MLRRRPALSTISLQLASRPPMLLPFFTKNSAQLWRRRGGHMTRKIAQQQVLPSVRITIMLVALVVAMALSWTLTGAVLPQDPREASLFQNTLLLVILGSSLLEHHFTKPADSVVNALTGIVTLLTVHNYAPVSLWWVIFSFTALVLAASLACVAVSAGPQVSGLAKWIAQVTYVPAVVLGQARLLFSVLFLFSLFSYFALQSPVTVTLVIFWALYISLWPLRIPQYLSSLWMQGRALRPLGTLLRTDDPDVLRFALAPPGEWTAGVPLIHTDASGNQYWVLPLFAQLQSDRAIGTALRLHSLSEPIPGLARGCVFPTVPTERPSREDAMRALGEPRDASLVGTVMESSSITAIRFEVLKNSGLTEGALVWSRIDGERVYYQVTEATTAEEALDSDRHGYRIAVAVQLGVLDESRGFRRFQWVPAMNAPVFGSVGEVVTPSAKKAGDFVYGCVPGSGVEVRGPFAENFNFHTAILGVTGSGKTELAFDLMRHAICSGIKVICIDLTQQYAHRLDDLAPVDLGISHEETADLSAKLFDVETGKFGAGDEKKALREFSSTLRKSVASSVHEFLSGSDEGTRLGLIQLEDISNTQASLYITELYMTAILDWARDAAVKPKVLVVVEEAHTVMPETSTMGLGDFGSKGLVGKIAQVALQGRKYGVGLLVLAQRTATVSKTVLTQCNTVISFASFDPTSIEFLGNVVGGPMARAMPTLKPLQAIMFGKGIRSDQPVIVEIPFDAEKAKAIA